MFFIVYLFSLISKLINYKEHFRLKKYNITLKEIAKVRYGSHCKFNINYHLVWIPKTRMKILVDPFKADLGKWINKICKRKQWYLLALEIMPDHIHLFISAHPKWSPMRIVQMLKQETSRKLRHKYSIIRQTRTNASFWATGYYCGTAGHVSAKQVACYIAEQTAEFKKNPNLFEMQHFEYELNNISKDQTTLDAYA
jgi:putative transposase